MGKVPPSQRLLKQFLVCLYQNIPGEVVEYAIEIIPTCNVFAPGHRLVADADENARRQHG